MLPNVCSPIKYPTEELASRFVTAAAGGQTAPIADTLVRPRD